MSTTTGLRKKLPSRADRVSVACQTDAPYSNTNGLSPASSQQLYHDNMGTSGSWKQSGEPSATSTITSDDSSIGGAVHSQEGSTSTKTTSTETPSKSDPSCNLDDEGEGVLKVTIQHFSKMTETLCSPSKRIRGVPWRIMVMPKQHMVQKKTQKCMGFFLQCCPDKTYSDAWSVKSDAEMRLVSQKPGGVSNFVRKTSHTYTAKENDWGYSCFMTWADVLDESQGYIKNDKVALEITVKAEWPKNMMSREEFVKSIDQWYNLAEMQMTRGLIDLSLEANNQALNFCKDKDEEMKKRLEDQKVRLVNQKVLASINRIETTKESPVTTEPLKPTSLRQALTGAQKNLAAKGTVKQATKKDRRATMQQMKKKKQDLANKEKELKRKTAEWEEVNSQLSSLSSEERKSPSIQSPPSPAGSPADSQDAADEAEGSQPSCHKEPSSKSKKNCPLHGVCPCSNLAKKVCQTVIKDGRRLAHGLLEAVSNTASSSTSFSTTISIPKASARSQACAVSVTHTVTKDDGTKQRCSESITMTQSPGGRPKRVRTRHNTYAKDSKLDSLQTHKMLLEALSDRTQFENFMVELSGNPQMIDLDKLDTPEGKLLSDNMHKITQEISAFHDDLGIAAADDIDEADLDQITTSDLDLDTDDSEDYQEHDNMRDTCSQCLAKDSDSCVHDSMESLREGVNGSCTGPVYVTENGCQTEETGEPSVMNPQAIPRRERRPAGTGAAVAGVLSDEGNEMNTDSTIDSEMEKMSQATEYVNKSFGANVSTNDLRGVEIDHSRLAKLFLEQLGVKNTDLAAMMALIDGSVSIDDPTIMPFLSMLSNTNIFSQLDTLSDDHGTCCLAAGLCAVQSRRILISTSDFFKIAVMIIDQTVETTAVISTYMKNYEDKDRASSAVQGRVVKTAVRRTGNNNNASHTPSDFTLNLSDDKAIPMADYEESELHIVSSALLNELLQQVTQTNLEQYAQIGETDFEKSIQSLLGDMGGCKVNHLIMSKLEELRQAEQSGKSTGGLFNLLNQLFEYSQALNCSGDHLERLILTAKKIHEYQQDKHVYHVQVSQVVKNAEERIHRSENVVKEIGLEMVREGEARQKLQGQLVAEEAKLKTERERTEQVQAQVKDVRNQLKKLQKKSDNDDNKIASLTSDKSDLEDKVKVMKKEIDSLKKKATEERNNRKKEKDRDLEVIRRLENDLVDRDAELERTRHSHEEKVKEWRNKESKWEKERKHHQATMSATIDRARAAEVAQLEMTLSTAMEQLRKAKDEVQLGISDAEDNLKRARTHADLDLMKKSMAEWRAVDDELIRLTKATKSEYDSAIDLVRKGTRMLAQMTDLKMPTIPAMPKAIRLPPVQVVQPSTPVTPSAPVITAPPAGVIGQPRTPHRYPTNGVTANGDMHSPSASSSSNGLANSHHALFARAPSPPATSPFKMSRGGMQSDVSVNTAPTSPWSWSTPLGNLEDIRPVSDSQSNHDLFAAPEPVQQTPPQLRGSGGVYGQPPLNGGGWTPQGTWRAPPLQHQHQQQSQQQAFPSQPHHQQSPHHQQMSRPPSMHYYD